MSFLPSRSRVPLTVLIAGVAFFLLGVGAAWPQGGIGPPPPACANPPPMSNVTFWQVDNTSPMWGAFRPGGVPTKTTYTNAIPAIATPVTNCPLGQFNANTGNKYDRSDIAGANPSCAPTPPGTPWELAVVPGWLVVGGTTKGGIAQNSCN